jgi:hypothetical protein
MKKTIIIFSLILIVLFGCTNLDNGNDDLNYSISEYYNESKISDLPNEEISDLELSALEEALMDEYKAYNTYEKVLEEFGSVRPFSNIINSEAQHINELKAIYEKYNLEVPQNPKLDVPDFDSVVDACIAGEEAEIANVAIYEKLFSQVDNEDIIVVFTALRNASEERHLPAFQRCGGRR